MNSSLILIVIVVVVVVAVLALAVAQRRRTDALRTRFGPEYTRTVEQTGNRGRAEAELENRAQRVSELRIRTLDPDERSAFASSWRGVQARFVDDPLGAVEEADGLVIQVMEARGYPVSDFDQRAADISVHHAQVVDHYRVAHRIATTDWTGMPDTEQLRQAMVHYRALFSDLLDATPDAPAEAPAMARDPAPNVAPDGTQAPVR